MFTRAILLWLVPGWLLIGLPGTMRGSPLTWQVVAFFPPPPPIFTPEHFQGSFVYDADTDVVSQWNIQLLPLYPPAVSFFGPHEACTDPLDQNCSVDSVSVSDMGISFTHENLFYGPPIHELILEFSAPLSDSGGTIPLVPACPPGHLNGEPLCGSFLTNSEGDSSEIIGGGVSTVGIPTPEPGAALYLALSGALFLTRRLLRAMRD